MKRASILLIGALLLGGCNLQVPSGLLAAPVSTSPTGDASGTATAAASPSATPTATPSPPIAPSSAPLKAGFIKVAGSVTSTAGDTLDGATITVSSLAQGDPFATQVISANGAFSAVVPIGVILQFKADKAGFNEATRVVTLLARTDGSNVDNLDMVLEPSSPPAPATPAGTSTINDSGSGKWKLTWKWQFGIPETTEEVYLRFDPSGFISVNGQQPDSITNDQFQWSNNQVKFTADCAYKYPAIQVDYECNFYTLKILSPSHMEGSSSYLVNGSSSSTLISADLESGPGAPYQQSGSSTATGTASPATL